MHVLYYHSIFAENAQQVARALNCHAQFQSSAEPLPTREKEKIIVFGAHQDYVRLLESHQRHQWDLTICQSEHFKVKPTAHFGAKVFEDPRYVNLLKASRVLDWSPTQARRLHEDLGLENVGMFAFDCVNQAGGQDDRPYDLCFVGYTSPSSEALLRDIRKAHPNLKIFADTQYGLIDPAQLTQILTRCKYVLNIPFYEKSVLATHRITKALACGCGVLSPVSACPVLDAQFEPYVHFGHLPDLVGQLGNLPPKKPFADLEEQILVPAREALRDIIGTEGAEGTWCLSLAAMPKEEGHSHSHRHGHGKGHACAKHEHTGAATRRLRKLARSVERGLLHRDSTPPVAAATPPDTPPVADPSAQSDDAPGPGSVCLCMIVKNEERVLSRALESVWNGIDRWCIVDTGSTDTTMSLIHTALGSRVKGTLHQRDWVDFATNRTEALDLAAAEKCDWILMFDADDNIEWRGDQKTFDREFLAGVAASGIDALRLTVIEHGNIQHTRPHLFRTKSKWKYVRPVHEYPVAREPGCGAPYLHLSAPILIARREGARSDDPNKYLKDAAVLEADLLSDSISSSDLARSTFYLAQSYHNAGNHDTKALELYITRSLDPNGFSEEAYVSCTRGIEILHRIATLAETDAERIAAGEKALVLGIRAARLNPQRAEAAHALMCLMRQTQKPSHRTALSRAALAVAVFARDSMPPSGVPPADAMFTVADVYEWKLHDEIAVAAFWENDGCGREKIGLVSARAALAGAANSADSATKDRLAANLEFFHT